MTAPNRILAGAEVLGELCLAALSFVFFKVVKFAVRAGLWCYYRFAGSQALRWRFVGPELFQTPGTLLMIMTTGPRWNTHAMIATAGPVEVKQSLAVNVASAQRSARVWTLVICSFPGYRAVTTIGSRNTPFGGPNVELPLAPGRYWFALRYYHWADLMELPPLTVDGAELIHATPVSFGVDDFYRSLSGRNDLLYRCLHDYVYVLLRYRRYLPAAFVAREFVPLGNPETRFEFGAMRTGERLSIQADPSVLLSYDVYVTIYNRASFPVEWFPVTGPEFTTAAAAAKCVYLVRIHGKEAGAEDFSGVGLKISVS